MNAAQEMHRKTLLWLRERRHRQSVILLSLVSLVGVSLFLVVNSGTQKLARTTSAICDSTTEGMIRYANGGDVIEFCDHGTWRSALLCE